jgi:hypothetical protein
MLILIENKLQLAENLFADWRSYNEKQIKVAHEQLVTYMPKIKNKEVKLIMQVTLAQIENHMKKKNIKPLENIKFYNK